MKHLHNEAATSPSDVSTTFERLFELAVLLAEGMDHGLAERGLTRARAEVLWRLHHQGPATQRALSQMLRCTPRNVTGLLDALETAGLVARRPHPTDRRATLVTLTRQGAAAAARMDSERQQAAHRVFAGIPAAEVTSFAHTLDQVLERLRDGAPGSAGR